MTASVRNDVITRPQARALSCLVAGGTFAQAAQAARVTERTLRRWRNSPEFAEALREGERAVIECAGRVAYSLARESMTVLRSVMVNPKGDPGPRVRAAAVLLDVALKWRDAVATEARIDALEQNMKELSK